VHPVQAYAGLGFLTLSVFLVVWLPARRQQGDAAGLFLMGAGVVVFMTELWRDSVGRGQLLGGAVDGPQVAAIAMVLAGALLLLERNAYRGRNEGAHG
jgi:phosphatidylglycerol:prolipoprotein diacylglycerol transferase